MTRNSKSFQDSSWDDWGETLGAGPPRLGSALSCCTSFHDLQLVPVPCSMGADGGCGPPLQALSLGRGLSPASGGFRGNSEYTRSQLESSAAQKDSFFARKMQVPCLLA